MKALRRCRNKIDADNVVLIDVDTYNFNNVIVIDVPENHTKKRGGSIDKSRPSRTYIYIDDDESPSNHHVGSNGASSSRRYDSDTHFTHENISPVKLSKGKRTYSNNRNGFSIQSDSDSSDEDIPDCECMGDSSGILRELWERASLNKNKQKHDQGSNFEGTLHEEKGESSVGNDNQAAYKDSLSDCDARDNEGVDHDNDNDDFANAETIPSPSSIEENEQNDDVNDPAIDDVPVENSIIDQREKHKQTDEYRRADEQELLAREIAIKIQAEEARQLRRLQKRKKAESLRLLDMERRQKQRVEEMRETQKKDEENMNLKEKYRTEVRQELKKLEITCLDMASLLRGLGIKIGDGPCPLSHEVRAAYKRALLSFHPDRASGSDMRQQVEAEEKFKLISRMKEKLSL